MIQVGEVLVSEDILAEEFVCNLTKCKGACCVEGNSGAPLTISELKKLEEVYPRVKKYLRAEGIAAIEKDGYFVTDMEGDYTTTCVDTDKECAYVIFENNITKCGIEKAYEAGEIDFQKPISCHLYPIRITEYPNFEVLNYDKWTICSPACAHGQALGVKVFEFLKTPLIRKYGKDWYEELTETASNSNL